VSRDVLTLNAGSSSLKFAVYDGGADLSVRLKGAITRLNGPGARFKAARADSPALERPLQGPLPLTAAAAFLFGWLEEEGILARLGAVGHRIVHGGRHFTKPAVLDGESLVALRRLVPLVPLHQPYNLDIAALAAARLPGILQIGCFDTAFHAERPPLDRLYGLPRELSEEGLVAYGFHGLSYQHIAEVLRARDPRQGGGQAIAAHLGSGASLCAMAEGRSIATTMGFSALDGLMMSTRCGALDPGIILHLMQERAMPAQEIAALLYQRSGLLGVSGISGDMQTLLESADPRAEEAVALFVYRAARQIGSLAAALGGLDRLVFTAGIGENSPAIRARICAAAAWLGVRLDAAANAAGETVISAPGSAVEVLVVPADEERAIAQAALCFLNEM